jgi:Uma2 family endonuclease
MIPSQAVVVHYPAEDDEPMAETELHIDAIVRLRELLEDLYRGRPGVFIGTDQFLYWEEGNPAARRAPEVMVAFGVPQREPRTSNFTWEENGVVPQFVCEFASEHSWREDIGEKFDLFEQIGVREYFVFDPQDRYLRPSLQGWRLHNDAYRQIRRGTDESLESQELGVRLLAEGAHVRLIDVNTGRKILTRLEKLELSSQELELSEQRVRQTAEQLQQTTGQLEAERRRVSEQEAEIARLKAELEALKKDLPPRG